jgi:hypothetical protein
VKRRGWLAVAALCAATAGALGALSQAYRGTLVRGLRVRQPDEWIAAGRPMEGVSAERALLAFAASERYFRLNDADLVSAARNFYFDRLATYLLALATASALCAAARTPPAR